MQCIFVARSLPYFPPNKEAWLIPQALLFHEFNTMLRMNSMRVLFNTMEERTKDSDMQFKMNFSGSSKSINILHQIESPNSLSTLFIRVGFLSSSEENQAKTRQKHPPPCSN